MMDWIIENKEWGRLIFFACVNNEHFHKIFSFFSPKWTYRSTCDVFPKEWSLTPDLDSGIEWGMQQGSRKRSTDPRDTHTCLEHTCCTHKQYVNEHIGFLLYTRSLKLVFQFNSIYIYLSCHWHIDWELKLGITNFSLKGDVFV